MPSLTRLLIALAIIALASAARADGVPVTKNRPALPLVPYVGSPPNGTDLISADLYNEYIHPSGPSDTAELSNLHFTPEVKAAGLEYLHTLVDRQEFKAPTNAWYAHTRTQGNRLDAWEADIYYPRLASGMQMASDEDIRFLTQQAASSDFVADACDTLSPRLFTPRERQVIHDFKPDLKRYFDIQLLAYVSGVDNAPRPSAQDKEENTPEYQAALATLKPQEARAIANQHEWHDAPGATAEHKCQVDAARWVLHAGNSSADNTLRRNVLAASYVQYSRPLVVAPLPTPASAPVQSAPMRALPIRCDTGAGSTFPNMVSLFFSRHRLNGTFAARFSVGPDNVVSPVKLVRYESLTVDVDRKDAPPLAQPVTSEQVAVLEEDVRQLVQTKGKCENLVHRPSPIEMVFELTD
ncbi:MAG: hypothetical protein JO142_18590 [Burkholderiales bacterium]|nr:hypothetical protein [Burkholderiales bacterium]